MITFTPIFTKPFHIVGTPLQEVFDKTLLSWEQPIKVLIDFDESQPLGKFSIIVKTLFETQSLKPYPNILNLKDAPDKLFSNFDLAELNIASKKFKTLILQGFTRDLQVLKGLYARLVKFEEMVDRPENLNIVWVVSKPEKELLSDYANNLEYFSNIFQKFITLKIVK